MGVDNFFEINGVTSSHTDLDGNIVGFTQIQYKAVSFFTTLNGEFQASKFVIF